MEMNITKTKIRFWNGLKTIGGTVISVEYGKSRVVFDFGLNYIPSESFSGVVKNRPHALVEDYINLNRIPPIDGLYSRKDLRNLTHVVPKEEDDRTTAVLISHIHLDHMGAMGLVSPEIPVYLTEDSLRLYKMLTGVGEGVFGGRSYSSISYNSTLNIGDIQVTAVEVDHDVPGACGFIIEMPDIRIIYSGDLRLHGKYPEKTMEFLKKAHSFKPDILIMEGTMINGEKDSRDTKSSCEIDGVSTEQQVKERFIERQEGCMGLVLFNVSETNLERIAGIIEGAKVTGRAVVLEPKTAYLMWKIRGERNFLVYMSEELRLQLLEERAEDWIKELTINHESISYDRINLTPRKYILQNSFKNLMELLDLNLRNSVYIHSNAIPLGAYDPDWEKLQIFLRKLNLDYEYIGSSGHAFHSHLKCMIDEIKPEILIPLHSLYPEKLYPESKIQFIPRYDTEYIVKDKKMIKLNVK